MNFLKRFVSDWFGYSRGERRASLVLVIIIALVILVRFTIPEKRIDISINAMLPVVPSEEPAAPWKVTVDQADMFQFDPNSASLSDLTSLGIPPKVAATLIRYRSKGGAFRRAEDILRVYGMDSMLARTLIPYIKIIHSDSVTSVMKTEKDAAAVKEIPPAVLIDINRCDPPDLEVLPGIGPVLSARIIKFRELLGGFVSVLQLKEVYGLADSVYNIISETIAIDTSAVRRININFAGFSELERHPYIERYEAQSIIKYRELKGRIEGLDELRRNRILTSEKIAVIRPYLEFI
jgi:DNA uptake protein ComE-like DNA-binding protein